MKFTFMLLNKKPIYSMDDKYKVKPSFAVVSIQTGKKRKYSRQPKLIGHGSERVDPKEARKQRDKRYHAEKMKKLTTFLHVYDSGTTDSEGKLSRLPMAMTYDFERLLVSGADMSPLPKMVQSLKYDDAKKGSGIMGVLPLDLTNGLVTDLYSRGYEHSFERMCFRGINQQRERNQAGTDGSAKYHVFSWGEASNPDPISDGSNWKKARNRVLADSTKELIDKFACEIVRRIWGEEFANRTDEEIAQEFMINPGIITTVEAYPQLAHIDYDRAEYGNTMIVHAPLCDKGMVLQLWPKDSKIAGEEGSSSFITGKFLYVPFGAFLALPVEVFHGGCFGFCGNMRFHMAIRRRLRNNLCETAKLLRPNAENEEEDVEYREAPILEKCHKKTTHKYKYVLMDVALEGGKGGKKYAYFSANYREALLTGFRPAIKQEWLTECSFFQ